jgi:calcineurin-like phosphoesterase family protein
MVDRYDYRWWRALSVVASLMATILIFGALYVFIGGSVSDPKSSKYVRHVLASASKVSYGTKILYDEQGTGSSNDWHEYEAFEDGTLCDHYTLVYSSERRDRLPEGVVVVYQSEGHGVTSEKSPKVIELEDPFEDRRKVMYCDSIVQGSNEGLMARWRRTGGRYLLRLASFDLAGFAVGYFIVSAILLSIVAFGAALSAAVVFAATSLARGLVLLARAANSPRSRSWTPRPACEGKIVCSAITDLHVGAELPIEIREGQVTVNGVGKNSLDLAARARSALNSAQKVAQRVIILGDVTDTGSDKDWILAVDALTAVGEMYAIPGNHDVSINELEKPDHFLFQRRDRARRYKRFTRRLKAYVDTPALIETPECNVLFVDSNRYKSRYILSNAVGLVGFVQRWQISRLLRKAPARPLLVCMHHHIARRNENVSVSDKLMNLYCIVQDGRELLRILQRYSRRSRFPTLVMHGHQHQTYLETVGTEADGAVRIFGLNSSTLGEKDGPTLDGKVGCGVVAISDTDWCVEWQSET